MPERTYAACTSKTSTSATITVYWSTSSKQRMAAFSCTGGTCEPSEITYSKSQTAQTIDQVVTITGLSPSTTYTFTANYGPYTPSGYSVTCSFTTDSGSSTTYHYACYDCTKQADISGYSDIETTSSSVTRPDLSSSKYTYIGYVYYTDKAKCIQEGKSGDPDDMDSTDITCSKLKATTPWVVFFYKSPQDSVTLHVMFGDNCSSITVNSTKYTSKTDLSFQPGSQLTVSATAIDNYHIDDFAYNQGTRTSLDPDGEEFEITAECNLYAHGTINTYTVTLTKPSLGVNYIYYKVGDNAWASTTTTKALTVDYGTTVLAYSTGPAGYIQTYTSSSPWSNTVTSSTSQTLTAYKWDSAKYYLSGYDLYTTIICIGDGVDKIALEAYIGGWTQCAIDKYASSGTAVTLSKTFSSQYESLQIRFKVYDQNDVLVGVSNEYTAHTLITSLPPEKVSKNYTGSSQSNGYTTPTGVTASGSTSGTNAGTYTASYTPKAGYFWNDTYKTANTYKCYLIINKVDPTITITTTDHNYTGSAQTIASATCTGGTYYLGVGSSSTSAPYSWVSGDISKTDIGTYYIWYKVSGDSNHNDIDAIYYGEAKIKPNEYTITYNANGGSGAPSAQTYTFVSTETYVTLSTTTPTRVGYSFTGWYYDKDCTIFAANAGGKVKQQNNNFTLFARWQYKVTILWGNNVDKVRITIGTTYTDYTAQDGPFYVNAGSTFTALAMFNSGSSYIFKHWNISTATSAIASNPITIQATANGMTITPYGEIGYNIKAVAKTTAGAKSVDPTSAKAGKTYGKKFTATLKDSYWADWIDGGVDWYDTRTKWKYDTASWTTTGTGTFVHSEGTTLEPTYKPNEDATITVSGIATAEAYQYRYHITYNPNGGKGDDPTPSPAYSDIISKPGEDFGLITVSNNTYTREHATFAKWNTASDGTGQDYTHGENKVFYSNKVLYAIWTLDPKYDITVKADPSEGGVVSGGGSYYEGETVFLEATKNTGYEFSGWYKGSEYYSGQESTTYKVETSKVTFTAKFKKVYNVNIQVSPEAGGSAVANPTSGISGTSSKLKATPNSSYEIEKWTDAKGTYLGNTEEITVTISEPSITTPDPNTYIIYFKKDLDKFYWSSTDTTVGDDTKDASIIYQGAPISNMKYDMWNRFNKTIKALNSSYTYDEKAKGDTLTAADFMKAYNAIAAISGHGTLPTLPLHDKERKIISGDSVLASYFNGENSLKTALNAAIK